MCVCDLADCCKMTDIVVSMQNGRLCQTALPVEFWQGKRDLAYATHIHAKF